MSKSKTITGLYKAPGQAPETRTIPNTLEALQALVGGYIETVTVATDCTFILNEEGKLLGLPPNFYFCGDVFVGPVFICSTAGGDFADLSLSEDNQKFLLASIRNNDCFGIPHQM